MCVCIIYICICTNINDNFICACGWQNLTNAWQNFHVALSRNEGKSGDDNAEKFMPFGEENMSGIANR